MTFLHEGQPIRQVQFTAGASGIYDPSHRPDLDRIIRRLPRGEEGALIATVDRSAVVRFRRYRSGVGLLPSQVLRNAAAANSGGTEANPA